MSTISTSADAADAPVDKTAKKALVASTVGYAMDGYDFLILASILGAIGADLGLNPAQRGSLATWTLIGAVVGGIGFGILSDYWGRVRVLTWTILLFAVFTGLGALAQGYWDLVIYRTIAGLGLGGEGYLSFSIATPTGEGVTSPLTFTRQRRCVMVEDLRII